MEKTTNVEIKAINQILSENEISMIKAMAKNNMNISATSREMCYHRNAILYHFDKTYQLTGLDPRVFCDLVILISEIEQENDDECKTES